MTTVWRSLSCGNRVALSSKIGTKALTKVMNVQARMPGIGVNSRKFGYAAHGTRSFGNKTLPKITNGWRMGWAQGSKKGTIVWRSGVRQWKYNVLPTSYKIRNFGR